MDAERLEDDFLAKADEAGIGVLRCSSWDTAEAWHGLSRIVVPRIIETPRDYLVAMHELGHCVNPYAATLETESGDFARLLRECAAWAWAVEHAAPVDLAVWVATLRDTLATYWTTALSHEGPAGSVSR